MRVGPRNRRFAIVFVLVGAMLGLVPFLAPPAAASDTGKIAETACYRASDAACTATISGGDISNPIGVAVSPDGKSVYEANSGASALTFFSRDTSTGALTQQANIATTGATEDVVVSPDNRFVYVTVHPNTIDVYPRDTSTGALSPPSCVSSDGTGGACTPATGGIDNYISQLALSPDGLSLYVVAEGVVTFSVDTSTGALTETGCVTGDPPVTGCTTGTRMTTSDDVVVSPDGTNVYVASYGYPGSVAEFDRTTSGVNTGAITQKSGTDACIDSNGSGCTAGHNMAYVVRLAVALDGTTVYGTTFGSQSVVVLNRNISTGVLSQDPGTAGCVGDTTYTSGCASMNAMVYPYGIAVSPDGRSVYTGQLAGFYCSDCRGSVVVLDRAVDGTLAEKSGSDGCFDDAASNGCGQLNGSSGVDNTNGYSGPSAAVVSPDGKNVYFAGGQGNSLMAFERSSVPSTAQTFTTPGENLYEIPPGVTTLHVTLVGGRGGTGVNPNGSVDSRGSGGRGAVVSTRLDVPSGVRDLYVEVGGNGSNGSAGGGGGASLGGANGGAGQCCGGGGASGGGGGGASDIRTCAAASVSCVLTGDGSDPRLAVAGGGGGGGGSYYALAGGTGGAAGEGATIGAGNGGDGPVNPGSGCGGNGCGAPGGAGAVGGSGAPAGSGGAGGHSGGSGGGDGAVLAGGAGGASSYFGGGGGGGGGGFFGAGGGGGGGDYAGGGGGGGGGSSFPAAASMAPSNGEAPYVVISPDILPPTFGTTDPVSPANNNAPKFRGAAEAGSTVKLYTNSSCAGTPAVSGTAAQFASPGLTINVSDNSTTDVYATATDASSNVSDCTTTNAEYVEDSPTAPTLTSTDPASPNASTSVHVIGSGPSGTAIFIWDNATCSGNALDGESEATFESPGIPVTVPVDTTTTFYGETRDASNVFSDCSTSHVSYRNNTDPDTQIDSHPTDPSNSTSPSFTYSSPDGGTAFECDLDSAGFASCPTSGTTYAGPLSEGSHTFSVRSSAPSTDQTPATFTWTIDTTAPDTTIDTHPTDPTNSTQASFTFHSSESPATFECNLDTGGFASCPDTGVSYSSFQDGSHTFEVQATDAAGNTDASPATFTWTVDTTGPTVTIDSGPANGSTSGPDPSFAFSSTAGDFDHFQCKVDSGSFGTCTSAFESLATSDGSHTFKVHGVDHLGNIGADVSRTWTVDATAPSAPTVTGPRKTKNRRPKFTLSDSSSDFDHFMCSLDGAAAAVCTSPYQPATRLRFGAHTLLVVAFDHVGNESAPTTKHFKIIH